MGSHYEELKDYENLIDESLYDAIEEQDFSISDVGKQGNNILIEIAQSTPLGEDWHETIWVKPDDTLSDVADAFEKYANDFDVEEAAMPFIECRGTHGVPESIQDLLNDAEWKKETLTELGSKLQEEFADCNKSFMKDENEIERD